MIPTPQAERVLVLCPHIDDDVIGCGGVLRQHAEAGAAVTSVYLRDGGPIREAEAHEAAKLIGIGKLMFLRGGPPPREGNRRRTRPGIRSEVEISEWTISSLCDVLEIVRPDLVYCPFVLDPHPDHAAATRLLGAVLDRGASVPTCYLYEIWAPLVPNALVEISAQAENKRQAINAHRSQVSSTNLAQGILGLNAYRAEMNRIHGYAEAFLRLKPHELCRMLGDLDE